jgi:outer membrane protein OmpA-like peptidoglycan-associated protein
MMYLKEKGIAQNRLQAKGYGENVPVNNCKCESCTEEQHQENRRTEFQILSLE